MRVSDAGRFDGDLMRPQFMTFGRLNLVGGHLVTWVTRASIGERSLATRLIGGQALFLCALARRPPIATGLDRGGAGRGKLHGLRTISF